MNGREKGSGLVLFLGLLLVTLLVATAAVSVIQHQQRGIDFAAAETLVFSNQALELSRTAKAALTGDAKAFEALQRFKRVMPQIDRVDQTAEVAGAEAADVRRAWNQFTMGLDELLESKETVVQSTNATLRTSQHAAQLRRDAAALQAVLSPVQQRESAVAFTQLEVQLNRVEEMLEALASESPSAKTLPDLTAAAQSIRQTVAALNGTEQMPGVVAITAEAAQSQLATLTAGSEQLIQDIPAMTDVAPALMEARRAAELVESAGLGLFAASTGVRNRIGFSPQAIVQSSWLPLALLGGALVCALGLLLSARRGTAAGTHAATDAGTVQSDKHQEAILRLLDEMGNLADGDLTVEATVTEDITGAIADSINYAIEALRDLVSTIDSAAESVDSAAQQTQAAANHLARASENQSRQVSSATDSITKMATSIEQVSSNAERSSEVARHSVEIAHKGGEAVRRTIDGMNTLRETIQDTSKRIKRLGESSQEIGNIVELINDIAEQTNILALNASIQASMAGEAGRGFAVVADEVQRLAERSTSATKQIEVLVKTIQSDTNEAVVSMERSTTDVVSGALLAENAGAALDEIEKVSNQIASLVQNISGMGRQQAMAAADVTRNMGVLQEISAQTAENTNATSHSIGKLAEMASRMRESVAGFSLPKEAEPAAGDIDDEILSELAAEKNEFIDSLLVDERNST